MNQKAEKQQITSSLINFYKKLPVIWFFPLRRGIVYTTTYNLQRSLVAYRLVQFLQRIHHVPNTCI